MTGRGTRAKMIEQSKKFRMSNEDTVTNDQSEEILTRCVVDVFTQKVYLYSNEGNERTVECDDSDEFVNVLQFIHSHLNKSQLFYSPPPA